jgi:hypothetical protein
MERYHLNDNKKKYRLKSFFLDFSQIPGSPRPPENKIKKSILIIFKD